jgi:YVTN family beta-propeller protein
LHKTHCTTSTGQPGNQLILASNTLADEIAITPDGQTAYALSGSRNSVTPITTATNTVGAPIAVGDDPTAIGITANSRTAYVLNSQSNTVTPISTATNTAGTPIPVGSYPGAIAIMP